MSHAFGFSLQCFDAVGYATRRASSRWVSVCWWWRFDWSFAVCTRPFVTTTSVILNSARIQNGDTLVPGCPVKWTLINEYRVVLSDRLHRLYVTVVLISRFTLFPVVIFIFSFCFVLHSPSVSGAYWYSIAFLFNRFNFSEKLFQI